MTAEVDAMVPHHHRRSRLVSHLLDEILACRAAAGKIEYFEEILARYRIRIFRLCYQMAGNAEDA